VHHESPALDRTLNLPTIMSLYRGIEDLSVYTFVIRKAQKGTLLIASIFSLLMSAFCSLAYAELPMTQIRPYFRFSSLPRTFEPNHDYNYLNTSAALSTLARSTLHKDTPSDKPPTTLAVAKTINENFISKDGRALSQLKIVTYNTGLLDVPIWGVPYADKRFPHFLEQLHSSHADIYMLQEVWMEGSLAGIQSRFSEYFVYSGSGKITHGLVILIKKSLLRTSRVQLVESAFAEQLSSEYFGYYNGVLGIRINVHGLKDPVYLLNTHLCPFAENQTIRNSQLDEIKTIISEVKTRGKGILILGGDFNQSPYQFESSGIETAPYLEMIERFGMLDTFAAKTGEEINPSNAKLWATLDPTRNKLSTLTRSSQNDPIQRLDYIFAAALSSDYFIKVLNAFVGSLEKTVPLSEGTDPQEVPEKVEVSDHYSYQTTISIIDRAQVVLKDPRSSYFAPPKSEGGLNEIQ